MLILSDEEDDEDYDTAVGIKPKSRKSAKIYVGSDDDDDDDSYPGGDDDDSDGYLSPLEHDKENQNSQSQNRNRNMEKRKNHPDSSKKGKNKGAAAIINSKKTPNPKPKKRRRRSSARFLRLSGRFGDEDAENENDAPEAEQLEKLNDMYSKAIQLNAANKINAVNSWGLNIIDKMDKFLGDDDVDADGTSASPIDVEDDVIDKEKPTEEGGNSSSNGQKKRVNFTKASCTIDACVKIYSYRVDDAHLTSYKVLANLNRTDGGKQKTTNDIVDTNGDDLDEEEENDQLNTRRRQSVAAVKTVETNMGEFFIPSKWFFST
jgi:condensin complex subunit 2